MSWFRIFFLTLALTFFAAAASAQIAPLPSCPTPNPNLLAGVAGHPFFPGCPLPADALNQLPVLSGSAPHSGNFAAWVSVPGTSNALQDSNISTTTVTATQAPSNAAMAALSITGLVSGVSGIYRQGYYNPGDGGSAHYTWSSSVCSLNSGAGDGGSQVRDGTGCWILSPPSGGIDVRVWGAQCGATDSSATLQSAVTYVAANKGGTVLIPCPITLSTGNVSLGNSVHLQGSGPVYWPVQTGLSTADGNHGTSNTWPPSIGSAINCTSFTNPCLILAGAGDEIDHINFGNPEPAPSVSGTYAPTAFPFIISSVLGSGWQGAYLHDLTCTSCYNWIDLEGLSSYSSVSLFSGTQLRIQHMWCDPCMGTALRLHDIDNPILEEGWEFTPTGWYFDSGPLGAYLRANAIGFDITYNAAGQFHDNDFFSLKSAIQYTNDSVTNNFGANTFAQSGAQFNDTMFNQVCQGITMASGAATTVVAPTVSFVGVQVWGDQSGNQCSKGKPFFALTSNNFNISMSHVGVWDVDTFASVGCGTPNTGSCPSGSPTLSNAILALDGVDAVSYATWTSTAPFIQCVSGAYVGLGISNMAAIRPANSATGTLFGPGLDGSQCNMAPLQVGGGTNAKEGSIQIKGSGDATHSGRAEFYLPNHNRNGYVGASNNLGIDFESDAGQIFLKPDFGTPGGPFVSLGVSGAGGSGSNLLLNLNPQPTAPPSGTVGGYECYDNAGTLYACASGLGIIGTDFSNGAFGTPTYLVGSIGTTSSNLKNAIVGETENSLGSAFSAFPAGTTGYGLNSSNAGNTTFGVYGLSTLTGFPGSAIGAEFTARNLSGQSGDTNLPPNLAIPNSTAALDGVHVTASTVTGAKDDSVGVTCGNENGLYSSPVFNTCMYLELFRQYGLFIEAQSSGVQTSAIIKNNGNGTALQLQTTNVNPNNTVISSTDGTNTHFSLRQNGDFYSTGHLIFDPTGAGGSRPTVSSCGVSPNVNRSNDQAGTITVGTGTISTCTVNFATAYQQIPTCVVTPQAGMPQLFVQNEGSTLLQVSSVASANMATFNFNYVCFDQR